MSVADELKAQYGSLSKAPRRRPLPVNPHVPSTSEVVIPDRALPGRARHGPRDYAQTPPRANSLPPEPKTFNYPHSAVTLTGQTPVSRQAAASVAVGSITALPEPVLEQYYGEYDPNLGPQIYDPQSMPMQPDFLPQLGPSSRQRAALPAQALYASRQALSPHLARPHPQPGIPHSHSAPNVPTQPHPAVYEHDYHLRTDYPEPIPDVNYQYQQVRQKRYDVPPGWNEEYGSPYSDRQAYSEDEQCSPPPPPPPQHSQSSPAVPQSHGTPLGYIHQPTATRFGAPPPCARPQNVQNSSPLQSIERHYNPHRTPPSHGHPARGRSFDELRQSPYQGSFESSPDLTPPNQRTPPSHVRTSPYGRPVPARHSVADVYSTPSRPHPLSQEVSRARSPNPYAQDHHHDYPGREAVPPIKPRALSPQPPPPALDTSGSRPKSSYSLQHPVRAFESANESPLSTSHSPIGTSPLALDRSTPIRKSVSPRGSMSGSVPSAVPFSPDSFDVHNPNTPGSETSPSRTGPIVGWHGQEIDPSDHLPVEAWAPEPEKKTPTKTYGLGRDRDFGPRTPDTGGRISKDTVINFTRKQQAEPEPAPAPAPTSTSGKIRAKLVKKSAANSPVATTPPNRGSFSSVPSPYEQQQYSPSFTHGSPAGASRQNSPYGPPSLPPKVPLGQYEPDHDPDALSREISSIDIGTSRRPPPTSYQPVRSHRDRNTYY